MFQGLVGAAHRDLGPEESSEAGVGETLTQPGLCSLNHAIATGVSCARGSRWFCR